jgi:hypothetical protein
MVRASFRRGMEIIDSALRFERVIEVPIVVEEYISVASRAV